MPDMLVKLYELPPLAPTLEPLAAAGVTVRRALAPEMHVVRDWVRAHFGVWTAEVEVCFARQPIDCFIAEAEGRVVGFACIEGIARGFFGPTGVEPAARGKGIGRGLLIAALHALHERGYAYAIIGGVGPASFYASQVGAVEIAGSAPGVYAGMLRPTG